MTAISVTGRRVGLACLALVCAASSWPHNTGTRGTHVLGWHNDTVARVVAPSFSWNNLGTTIILSTNSAKVDDNGCIRGELLDVDVADGYAF
ncbi:MAG: hypothetical protein O7H39_18035, partial [Gammaproteobacteria bacterium]|nr:hypothetical protein [Gammaproteobacteria bacterium]